MRLKPHEITFSVPDVKSETTYWSNNIDHQTINACEFTWNPSWSGDSPGVKPTTKTSCNRFETNQCTGNMLAAHISEHVPFIFSVKLAHTWLSHQPHVVSCHVKFSLTHRGWPLDTFHKVITTMHERIITSEHLLIKLHSFFSLNSRTLFEFLKKNSKGTTEPRVEFISQVLTQILITFQF